MGELGLVFFLLLVILLERLTPLQSVVYECRLVLCSRGSILHTQRWYWDGSTTSTTSNSLHTTILHEISQS